MHLANQQQIYMYPLIRFNPSALGGIGSLAVTEAPVTTSALLFRSGGSALIVAQPCRLLARRKDRGMIQCRRLVAERVRAYT